MSIDAGSRVVVRRGRPSDLDEILDLLTGYGLGREFFAPRYERDPTYRPELSWVAVLDGRIVAHVRVFDRTIRLAGGTLRVAGVGNVITAEEHRRAGHAGRLLEAMLDDVAREGFPYSLLWTHVSRVYARYGWATIGETRVRATVDAAAPRGVAISADDDPDLDSLAALYDEANRGRTGPALRTRDDWRAQRAWTGERILVARERARVVGYARHREGEILDVAAPHRPAVLRALLAAIVRESGGAARGRLPPSDVALLAADERALEPSDALMGRVVDRAAFVAAVEHVVDRATLGPLFEDQALLARLLFHGAAPSDRAELRERFPPRDFVIWEADAF